MNTERKTKLKKKAKKKIEKNKPRKEEDTHLQEDHRHAHFWLRDSKDRLPVALLPFPINRLAWNLPPQAGVLNRTPAPLSWLLAK